MTHTRFSTRTQLALVSIAEVCYIIIKWLIFFFQSSPVATLSRSRMHTGPSVIASQSSNCSNGCVGISSCQRLCRRDLCSHVYQRYLLSLHTTLPRST